MQSDLRPLIHIGYAKAGSTTVQSVLGDPESGFAVSNEVRQYTPQEVCDSVINHGIAMAHDYNFDPDSVRQYSQELLGWTIGNDKVPAISSEAFAGHWKTGGVNMIKLAHRIAETWPNAKILIVFREQRSMLNSVYRQYIKKGGFRTLSQLINPEGSGQGRVPDFDRNYFKYDLLVKTYQDLFGQENVLALPIEMLKNDFSSFFHHIFHFSGIENSAYDLKERKENAGISALKAQKQRLLNPLIRKDSINDYSALSTTRSQKLGKKLLSMQLKIARNKKYNEAEKKLKHEIQELCKDYYEESNRNLRELTGIDLQEYGYAL